MGYLRFIASFNPNMLKKRFPILENSFFLHFNTNFSILISEKIKI